jgi:hypothetical protein
MRDTSVRFERRSYEVPLAVRGRLDRIPLPDSTGRARPREAAHEELQVHCDRAPGSHGSAAFVAGGSRARWDLNPRQPD